jgi:N-acetylglucosaminyl-diphospho-decaprenol L-rhamnosyltransferase
MPASVAVVIVNYRTPDMTLACVAALAKERAAIPDLRAVIVDGGSGDGSAETIRAGLTNHDWVDLLPMDINGGFGWANNQGMLHLIQGPNPPDFIHLLNPDTLVERGAVIALLKVMADNPKCAAAGSQLVNPGGSLAGSAFRFPSVVREFFRGGQMNRVGQMLGLPDGILRPTETTKVDWVTGASVMLRTEALRQTGLFDTGFFLYFEEVELMHRLSRAGWDVLSVPASRVMHVGGVATGMADAELHERTSIPDYMFASRRRFFALTQDAESATRAWLAGNRLLRIIKALGINSDRPSADAERAGMLKHGIAASDFDRTPAVTQVTDKAGEPPAWRRAQ